MPNDVSYSRSQSVDSGISTNSPAAQAPQGPGERPAGPAPPPPPKPNKDHREHLLSYASVGKDSQAKVPPPTLEKPNKKPKPSVPKRTVSLHSLSSQDPDSSMSVEGDDEPFPPPPPESELLANQPHLLNTESSQYLPYQSSCASCPDCSHGSQGIGNPQPNFAPADFPDADTSSVTSRQFSIPPMVEKPKTPKPVLKKKSSKKSRKALKKSVTFSDSISLIAEKEDIEEPSQEVDYMAYVQNLLAHKKRGAMTKATSNPDLTRPKYEDPKEALALRNGYDSDFDEDTSDSENSVENNDPNSPGNNNHVRCNLCRKRVIDVNDMYCTDCKFYMSKFQPQT